MNTARTRLADDAREWAIEFASAVRDKDKAEIAKRHEELSSWLLADPAAIGLAGNSDVPAAVAAAAGAKDHTAARAILRERVKVHMGPALRPLAAGASDPEPEPLLWHKSGAVLCRGEVAILAGGGGAGKSTLALQWALAAEVAAARGEEHGESCGLSVRAGRVAILSYEDSPKRIAMRRTGALQLLPRCERRPASDNGLATCADMRGWPLYGVREGEHAQSRPGRLAAWNSIWQQVAAQKVDLVVIDPAMSAYAAEDTKVAFVRAFLEDLHGAAAECNPPCGVLLLAHSTKTARAGRDRAGLVAGSAAWTDAARSALALIKEDEGFDESGGLPSTRQLRCVKANYGPSGWHERLFDRRATSGEFLGYVLDDRDEFEGAF